jgi:hypothetical protein
MMEREKMDFSNTYINMCDKAKELQMAHSIYEAGDFYYEGNDIVTNQPKFSVMTETHDGKKRAIGNLKTWLPRQDQLQMMLGDYHEQCNIIHKHLMKEAILNDVLGLNQEINTMEQLLLTIVMRQNYFKEWQGTGWVKPTGDNQT